MYYFTAGLIGPSLSEESQRVSEILTQGAVDNSFLQISVSATAVILGEKPIYPNYYRVIPDDSKQIEVICYFSVSYCIIFGVDKIRTACHTSV